MAPSVKVKVAAVDPPSAVVHGSEMQKKASLSDSSEAKRRRRQRRDLVKRRKEKMTAKNGNEATEISQLRLDKDKDKNSSKSKTGESSSLKKSVSFASKADNDKKGKSLTTKTNSRSLLRHKKKSKKSKGSEPPTTSPIGQHRQASLPSRPEPKPSDKSSTQRNSNYDDEKYDFLEIIGNNQDEATTTSSKRNMPALFGCTSNAVVQALQETMQTSMEKTCTGDESSLSQGMVGATKATEAATTSWCNTIDSVKERFRSQSMPETCCDMSDANAATVTTHTITGVPSKISENLVTAGEACLEGGAWWGETVLETGALCGTKMSQTGAWCGENVSLLSEGDGCSSGHLNNEPTAVAAGAAGMNLAESEDVEKAVPDATVASALKKVANYMKEFSANATSATCHGAMATMTYRQPREKIVLDLPPDFGHDAKNFNRSEKKQSMLEKIFRVVVRTPERCEASEKSFIQSHSHVPGAECTEVELNKAKEEPEAATTEMSNSTHANGPREPDGDKPVPEDANMERRGLPATDKASQEDSLAKGATLITENSMETSGMRQARSAIIDCTAEENIESDFVSQGTASNPILLVEPDEELEDEPDIPEPDRELGIDPNEDKELSEKCQENMLEMIEPVTIEMTKEHEEIETKHEETETKKAAKSAAPTKSVPNKGMQNHLKVLVDGYMERLAKQKNVDEKVFSSRKDCLENQPEESDRAIESLHEQRESPPSNEPAPSASKTELGRPPVALAGKSNGLLVDSCRNEVVSVGARDMTQGRTSVSKNIKSLPFELGIIDVESLKRGDHRDDTQVSVSRDDDTQSWLFHEDFLPVKKERSPVTPYSPLQRHDSFHSDAKSVSSIRSCLAKKSSVPKPAKSVSWGASVSRKVPAFCQDGDTTTKLNKADVTPASTSAFTSSPPPKPTFVQDGDTTTKFDRTAVIPSPTSDFNPSLSSRYQRKRAAILARREELALLAQRHSKIYSRGHQILASRLEQDSIFSTLAS